ncbi:Major Facilitator Superfamily transporter [Thioflavicoccus mobilis 8321]|uniref:Major Facilitator Superfamily transporter n=1 Tax=Thioflavicoccus mobilis 8321 TaxID=765912 RepID=L0H2A5_9GAMM|nr:AmpG family muropeptide MFS transporter [Thioflavicoccus mobilis]AGA91785.1 Major Facilitator Superfamily transporter [Thioflavicoccus mobilis 8321]
MIETQARSSSIWRTVFSGRMAVAAVMGFSCGLPLLLTLSVLQAWMTEEGVDLGTIGLFALVQLPYTLKFLWAPLTDRFTLPFLGRRRGWLLVFQTLLMLAIIALGLTNPVADPWLVAGCALAVTFFSASQDIVVDAYRREALADDELGLGASLYVNGYRIGMLLAGGGGLILADFVSFQTVYLLLGLAMLVGIVTTLLAPEPAQLQGAPRSIRAAVVEPFVEFFRRDAALWILAFILLYKLGDSMASAMTTPFYLDIGFSKSEIGAVVKLFGFWATIAGGLLGGLLILRAGLYRSLWYFGLLQAVSTAGFALLALVGPSTLALAGVIAFENLSGGMGTAAFVGFMAALTDRRFTATQYALLSSLMGVPRVLASAPTGYLAEGFGWVGFFVLCTLIAIPGLLILRYFKSWAVPRPGPAAGAA